MATGCGLGYLLLVASVRQALGCPKCSQGEEAAGHNVLDRLLEILAEARDAVDMQTLDNLTLEVDALVTHAVRQA